ncbi:MAG: bifunctional D-glycero-beta-D-manno-heptose-7-phosphate kinase/D-glycero-beta-D-manno-heptose 1-phosphate adenylyltransferase HldE [Zoogloeaceae bacterium]|nr:bifunctional D-glycero-beta-D-manno-heptose-7-phosphate kinase/D-glycero-beta-D-manno-heptose 1-phosphate adenylyltransferase HldE [Gammaproteobacteria bacterium]MCP5230714.1 bifunctional D-glycero-beta-D-manno-heptose-7-phosphate kinase/D-glycero-beta-D-manno-heptose 1-phosphate adenylyltransferase HldE [Zoogloeaceae bacterium]
MTVSIPDFSKARVLVVGDVMLDRYWHGGTSRISPEAPVPVVNVAHDEERVGGAGNVALNVVSLGGQGTVLGLVGDDEPATALRRQLELHGVGCAFETVSGSRTITKLRILSRHQQLIRLDFEDGFPEVDPERILGRFKTLLAQVDVVIMSDYAKGCLRDKRGLIEAARAAGKPVLVDPKTDDFSCYHGATVITPNLSEFEAVVGKVRDEADMVEKGMALIERHQLEALLITRSENGMTLLRRGHAPLHQPTRAREVYDVTGAGDTVIATLAAGIAAGLEMGTATALANLAAGIVVGKVGTATPSIEEMYRALHEHTQDGFGVVDEATLLGCVAAARARGERVVMTNGVFDILHAGHVSYLAKARALGDRLIVAVNTDASVKRLGKGDDRPINALANRMQVLAALEAVDWVVSFDEDTPERLICLARPDHLVKGGDYKPEDIAGYDCVTANGGRVDVLEFVDGCSTTSIINAIRKA